MFGLHITSKGVVMQRVEHLPYQEGDIWEIVAAPAIKGE